MPTLEANILFVMRSAYINYITYILQTCPCKNSGIQRKRTLTFGIKEERVQLLSFWTLFIVLLLFKTHNISEAGFCLRLRVEPIQWDPIDRASPYFRTPVQTQDRTNFIDWLTE
jgi:hypothetical protein